MYISRLFIAILASLFISIAQSNSLHANNTTTLNFTGVASSSGVTVKYNGTNTETGIPGPYYWKEVNAPLNSVFPNPTTTFCVDLAHSISVGTTYSYSYQTLASTPGLTTTQIADITKLWGADYNSAWNSTNFKGSDASTAFQLALWKLIYDGGTNLNLSTANFIVVSANSNAVNEAQTWLNSLDGTSASIFATNNPNEQLLWLSNGSSQSQITEVPLLNGGGAVPAPPGIILGLVGFTAVLIRRRFTTPQTA